MRALLVLGLILASFSAQAAPWIGISPDRENRLYVEGESAKFLLRQLHYPDDPAFSMEISVIGPGGEEIIEAPQRVGVYLSAPLAEGVTQFQFRAKLKGPGGWEKLVEENVWEVKAVAE